MSSGFLCSALPPGFPCPEIGSSPDNHSVSPTTHSCRSCLQSQFLLVVSTVLKISSVYCQDMCIASSVLPTTRSTYVHDLTRSFKASLEPAPAGEALRTCKLQLATLTHIEGPGHRRVSSVHDAHPTALYVFNCALLLRYTPHSLQECASTPAAASLTEPQQQG